MQLKKMIPLGVLLLAMAGCASVPMGDPQKDAALKTFSAPQGKAAIYVYRNESMGAAVKMSVTLDGQTLGDTLSKTYLYTEVDPGPHQLVSKSENDSTLNVDTVAGKNYYIWQEVKMGILSARSKLQVVDDKTGQDGVTESKLTVSTTAQTSAAK